VHELYRLLNRNDVPRIAGVDVIDQRGQGRRLAGTGWAGDEDEAAAQIAELLHDRRDTEFLEGSDARRNEAKDGAVTVCLLQVIAAETRVRIHLVGKIEIAPLFKDGPACRSANFAQHRGRFLARNDLFADRHDITMLANLRRLALSKVQIGSAFSDNDLKEFVYARHRDS
jgi:hypothetical protein